MSEGLAHAGTGASRAPRLRLSRRTPGCGCARPCPRVRCSPAFALVVLAQALTLGVLPLAGAMVAPRAELAGWPMAAFLLGAAAAKPSASLLLDAFGRRAAFAIGAGLGVAGGLAIAHAILWRPFRCSWSARSGSARAQGFGMFYRHAAALGAAAWPLRLGDRKAARRRRSRRPLRSGPRRGGGTTVPALYARRYHAGRDDCPVRRTCRRGAPAGGRRGCTAARDLAGPARRTSPGAGSRAADIDRRIRLGGYGLLDGRRPAGPGDVRRCRRGRQRHRCRHIVAMCAPPLPPACWPNGWASSASQWLARAWRLRPRWRFACRVEHSRWTVAFLAVGAGWSVTTSASLGLDPPPGIAGARSSGVPRRTAASWSDGRSLAYQWPLEGATVRQAEPNPG